MPVYTSCTNTTATTTNLWYHSQATGGGGGTSGDTIWYTWVDNGTGYTNTAASTNDGFIWSRWVTVQDTLPIHPETPVGYCPPPPLLTPEQEAEYARLAAGVRRQVEEHQREQEVANKRKAALDKSMTLLREHLTEKQRKALDKHGWFLVEGGKTKNTYRINGKHCSGNVRLLCKEGKKELLQYCCHAEHNIPLGDQLLTQLLHLKHDEDHFIARANKTTLTA